MTAKSVARTAKAFGGDIAASEQREIRKAVQLDLAVIVGEPIPILYVQMDGTGVPVVQKETEGRKGKDDGQPAHTGEVKLGCVLAIFARVTHFLCLSCARSSFPYDITAGVMSIYQYV